MSDVCEAQPLNKAVGNAYIITRMAEKFHVQPRPVNDTFSNDLFNRFLNDLDEERIYFNRQDIARLSAYSLQLDDQVKQRKTDFLKLLVPIYQRRLQQADSLIDAISKTPLNFTLAEKFSVAEDSSYPSDLSSMYTKLYKKIKLDVLGTCLTSMMTLHQKIRREKNKFWTVHKQFFKKDRVRLQKEHQTHFAIAGWC
jgi:carboxyl-terminal processing protease